MKVFSLSVILAPPSGTSTVLSTSSDLSSFSFYQKGSVGEFLSFFSKTVAERTPQTQRQSVQENNYTAHVYNRGGAEQLAGKARYLSCIEAQNWPTMFSLSCHHNRSRVPRPTCVLTSDEASGWLHIQSTPNVVQQPVFDIIPWDQHVHPEVPRSTSGRYYHEGTARVGRD